MKIMTMALINFFIIMIFSLEYSLSEYTTHDTKINTIKEKEYQDVDLYEFNDYINLTNKPSNKNISIIITDQNITKRVNSIENPIRQLDSNCTWSYAYNKTTGTCIQCKTAGLYYQNGICVSQCDYDYRLITELNVCYKCDNLINVYFNGQCMEACPNNTIYYPNRGLCYQCQWIQEYYSSGACVTNCPITTMIDNVNMICVNCKDLGSYVYNMTCMAACPAGTTLNDFFTNFCIDCYLLEKYNNTGFCQDSCGTNLERNFDQCVDCASKILTPILNNGKCDTKCNVFDVYNSTSKQCASCKAHTPSKFLSNISGNNASCVLNCGNYSANYKMNYCITNQIANCAIIADSCNNNGLCNFVNSNSSICICNENSYGEQCEYNNLSNISNCTTVIDQMLNILSLVNQINFSLINNAIYNAIFEQYYNCAVMIPQYLQNVNSLNKINNFLLTYYSSNEVSQLLYSDLEKFIYHYDIFLNILNYNLWNNYIVNKLNSTALLSESNIYIKNFQTFIEKLFMLAPYFFSNGNFSIISLILGKYDYYWGKQLQIDIFNSNLYNQRVYNQLNREKFHTYLKFKTECDILPINSTIITINLDTDLSYFSSTFEYFSNNFYFGVLDQTFLMDSVSCPFILYFPVRDNLNFNFSQSIEKWQEVEKLGINPLDPTDPYFTEICYSYPKNLTLITYKRSLRISNYFMNYTIACMGYNFISNVAITCSFAGFENSFDDFGPNPYVKCQCNTIDSNTYYYIVITPVTNVGLSMPFLQVWNCLEYGFYFRTSFYNPGFYAILLVYVLQGVGLILHFITLEIQFLDYFPWIRRHDMENIGLMTEDERKKSQITMIKTNIFKKALEPKGDSNAKGGFFGLGKNKRKGIIMDNMEESQKSMKQLFNLASNIFMSDYYYLPYSTFLYMDERDLLIYFCDYWHDYHIFSITFIKFGYFMPRSLRILNFYLYLLNHFFIVALILNPDEDNIDIFGNDYSKSQGVIIMYAFLSSVFTNVVYYLMTLFLQIPREVKLYMNRALMKKYYTIREFHKTFYKKMSTKLIIFLVINFLLQIMMSIFVINHNAIYLDIKMNWLYFTIMVLCIDFLLVSNVIPLIALILRVLVKHYKFEKFYKAYGFFEKMKNERKYG